jgi:hypothetical protein
MAGERLRSGIDAVGDWVSLRRRGILLGLGGLLVVSALGVGAYYVGLSTGEDLEAARAEGISAGQKRGSADGRQEGYQEGYRVGRRRGFDQAYPPAYRDAFLRELKNADLDAPTRVQVPDPTPNEADDSRG